MRFASVATEFWIFVLLPVFLGMIREDIRRHK